MQSKILVLNAAAGDSGLAAMLLYACAVLALLAILLFLAGWLGEKKKNQEKSREYECGIIPDSPARVLYPAPFYLFAAFFLIFDIETVFVFAWAAAFMQLGWPGWGQITFFMAVLLLSLAYVWKKGGLAWS